MRALVQRVTSASVTVEGNVIGKIGPGVVTLLGIGKGDTEKEVEWIIQKISKLRIFEDASGKMNLSLADAKGAHLLVSQFTLYGNCTEGNRPSFFEAAPPDEARALYEKALDFSKKIGLPTEAGQFQAHMVVDIQNDGPVTLWIESPPSLKAKSE